MRKQHIFLSLIVVCFNLIGQEYPSEIEMKSATPAINRVLPKGSGGCSYPSYGSRDFNVLFMPNESMEKTYINVNLVFIQKADSTGNFNEYNSDDNDLWDDIQDCMNERLSNLTHTNEPKCHLNPLNEPAFIPDTKLEFVFKRYYLAESSFWDNNNNYACPDYWPGTKYEVMNNSFVARDDYRPGINVYFNESKDAYDEIVEKPLRPYYIVDNFTGDACSQHPKSSDLTRTSSIHMPCMYVKKYWMEHYVQFHPDMGGSTWEGVYRGWYIGSTAVSILHELGHSLWLDHSCDQYLFNDCPVAVMSQFGPRTYIPPTEVGQMYSSLAFTSARQFVVDSYQSTPLVIDKSFLWNFEVKLLRSINIESGGDLNLSCKTLFVNQAKIKIYEHGRCHINCGELLSSNADEFAGIEVLNGGVLVLENTDITAYKVTVRSGGTLIIKGDLTLRELGAISVDEGGYICMDPYGNYSFHTASNTLKLHPGYFSGVNGAYVTEPTSCSSDMVSILVSGEGGIKTYLTDVYIQNESVSSNKYYTGRNIYIGESVTTSQPQGAVSFNSGTSVVLEAGGEMVVFDKGFESELGSVIEVKIPKNNIYGTSFSNPIDLGSLVNSDSFINIIDNSGMGDNYTGPDNQISPDVFFKFELSAANNLLIKLCDSEIDDGFLHLLDSQGNRLISVDDDYDNDYCSEALMPYLDTTLSSGIYYIVVEGYYDNVGSLAVSLQVY